MAGIIRKPIVNERFSKLNESGVYGFVVDKNSNKIEITKAIEKMFGVNVDSVNTMVVRGKTRTRFQGGRNMVGKTQSYKKAIVRLKEGETIDFFADL